MTIQYQALSSSANQIAIGKNIYAEDIRQIVTTYNFAAARYPKQHLNHSFWGETHLLGEVPATLFASSSSTTYQRFLSTDVYVDRYEVSGTFRMEANVAFGDTATGRLILSGSTGALTASISRTLAGNSSYGSTSFDLRTIKNSGQDEWIWVRFEGARSAGTSAPVYFGGISFISDSAVSSSATFPVDE